MRASIVSTMTWVALALFTAAPLSAQSPYQDPSDFTKYATKLRESALLKMEPMVTIPTGTRPAVSDRYPWKTGIVTTVFWIGSAGQGQGESGASAWDPKWQANYGGFDNPHPDKRKGFIPTTFVPRLNPFYIALPYNDVSKGHARPEAKVVIPWFKDAFVAEGTSVCRDRWLAIRSAAGKICYAQWNDCGPFHTDHWQYVFGNEKPRPNANGGAGLNVSPAVRDYLELSSTDVTDWKFVDARDVPTGPWALYGTNNPLTRPDHRLSEERAASPASTSAPAPAAAIDAPVITTKKSSSGQ